MAHELRFFVYFTLLSQQPDIAPLVLREENDLQFLTLPSL